MAEYFVKTNFKVSFASIISALKMCKIGGVATRKAKYVAGNENKVNFV